MTLHRNVSWSMIHLMLMAFALSFNASAQAELPRFEPGECAFAVPAGAEVECGDVVVAADRTAPDAGEIRLATAIFRAAEPAPDPVFFLQGGPGGGIVAQISVYYPSFVVPITAERDFVVFDQRGTGLSSPSLDCTEVSELLLDNLRDDLTPDELNPRYLEALTGCRDRLAAEGIDFADYTSTASTEDIADIAAVLGYEQVNLYGGSYGTRLALTVMRDNPALVRSTVLDGVLAPSDNQVEILASKSDYALSAFFDGCATDPACAEAYPDLEATFYATVERLRDDPAPITVTLPTTGEVIETTVDDVDFIGSVFVGLQQTALIPALPSTIQAVADGDTTPLQTFLLLPVLIADNINIGMYISVLCAEEIPATTPEALDAAAEAFPVLERFVRTAYYGDGAAFTNLCAEWGAAQYDPRESEIVSSDIPSLLLAGAYDPATPPYFAEAAAETLSTSSVVVVPASGHVVTPAGGCPLDIALAFLNDPGQTPDASCIAAITPEFQTPSTEIALTALDSETFGFTSVIPEGWTELAPGSGTYGESATAQVVILQQAAPIAQSDLLALVAGQFGSADTPEVVETLETERFTWSLYSLTFQGQPVDLALAERDGTTYLVALIVTQAQRDLYYNGAFLPALEAITPK